LVRLLSSAMKLVSIVVLTVMLAGGSVWFFNYWQDQSRSEEIGRPVTIDISEDDDSGSVADKLADADLIRYGFYFETRMRFSDVELQPGTYTLRIGMSVPQIIDEITVPDTGSAETETGTAQSNEALNVTFIEGQRLEQNAAVLQDAGMPDAATTYVTAAQDTDNYRSNYSFLESVPKGASLEGFLFPDTYRVGANASPSDVIRLQLTNFESKFTPEMVAQAKAEGLSVYQVVTIASIVEREAAIPEERPIIAAVYLNRLDQGMSLGADPAQQYGIGTPDNWWPTLNTELLEKSKSTAYDTYLTVGLPPGPIANPGKASLQAVVQPADVDYLYFVTKDDESGEHDFSTTLEEHNRKTCEYHPDWDICAGGVLPGQLPWATTMDRLRIS